MVGGLGKVASLGSWPESSRKRRESGVGKRRWYRHPEASTKRIRTALGYRRRSLGGRRHVVVSFTRKGVFENEQDCSK